MGARVPKTRNNGTMTEAAFWGWIRSTLRKRSQAWKPLQLAKLMARRPYKGENKRLKFEYQCNHCKLWFPEKQINVDHIVEAGSLTKGEDLKGFVERLFCEVSGLQILCETCHHAKTQNNKKAK